LQRALLTNIRQQGYFLGVLSATALQSLLAAGFRVADSFSKIFCSGKKTWVKPSISVNCSAVADKLGEIGV
jgi:hypothetical protein